MVLTSFIRPFSGFAGLFGRVQTPEVFWDGFRELKPPSQVPRDPQALSL